MVSSQRRGDSFFPFMLLLTEMVSGSNDDNRVWIEHRWGVVCECVRVFVSWLWAVEAGVSM